MHLEAFEWVRARVGDRRFARVVEFGARDINGSVRPLFKSDAYHGIDLYPGPGVDEVADAAEWRGPRADCIVCCEVLEHAPDVPAIMTSARRGLHKGGLLVVTCATDPRVPHSAHDGGAVRDDEHYRNVPPVEFAHTLQAARFNAIDIDIDSSRGDLYATARAR